jgi:hypothetical protein
MFCIVKKIWKLIALILNYYFFFFFFLYENDKNMGWCGVF